MHEPKESIHILKHDTENKNYRSFNFFKLCHNMKRHFKASVPVNDTHKVIFKENEVFLVFLKQ